MKKRTAPLLAMLALLWTESRWAKQHGIPTYEGHLAGYNALKEVAAEMLSMGVEYLSAYIFSTENWKRSKRR